MSAKRKWSLVRLFVNLICGLLIVAGVSWVVAEFNREVAHYRTSTISELQHAGFSDVDLQTPQDHALDYAQVSLTPKCRIKLVLTSTGDTDRQNSWVYNGAASRGHVYVVTNGGTLVLTAADLVKLGVCD